MTLPNYDEIAIIVFDCNSTVKIKQMREKWMVNESTIFLYNIYILSRN